MNATAALKRDELAETMEAMGRSARAAAIALADAPPAAKDAALRAAAAALRARTAEILAANAEDIAAARARGLTPAMIDRLVLSAKSIDGIAAGLEAVAGFPDPVGAVTADWTRPNGMRIQRVRTPLGVIGIIYESRPNVTADAGSLCLKAGNACILRGGSESSHSSAAIHACLVEGLRSAGLPEAAIQLVATTDRAAVGHMLAMSAWIDVIVPRGGKSLIERVQREARMAVLAHRDGNNHVYVHAGADLERARAIVMNAKMRRVSVCGAAETLLVDADVVQSHLKPILADLLAAGCEVRGDRTVQALDARVKPASEADWDTEYLDAVIAVRVVAGLDEAVTHITRHGSAHTDAIVTEDAAAAEAFLKRVDSAIVLHNASTQFADGAEFGFGAEIGISTGRLHARGPVGIEQLTSFKYVVHGSGQIRP